ncbi:creatininase [Halobacteriales archaeon QS_8_69_26]|nr:MAG: creatininase [Halobacteriales archaeon QS_8_69_26]
MVRLAEHTTTTAAEALDDAAVALLPVGSTEQHGPALPLGTDFMAARALAREFDDADRAVVLPTVPVGVSPHHRQFDGTLSVTPETFERYVEETVASLAEHGVRKAVLVNGHGGNTDALFRAARTLRDDRTAFAPPWNWWDALGELPEELFDGHGSHAGAVESSVMLSVAEHLVREDALAEAEAGASEGWGRTVHGAEVGFDTADFSESGAVGTPTEASVEAGKRLFGRAADELGALVGWLADRPVEECWPREHR